MNVLDAAIASMDRKAGHHKAQQTADAARGCIANHNTLTDAQKLAILKSLDAVFAYLGVG